MSEDAEQTDDNAFVGRLTAAQPALRAYILGLTPRRADADDVLQEVNLALWRKRQLYDPTQNFLRWAFGFTSREIRYYRRRAANSRLWFSDSVADLLTESWPDDSILEQQRREALAMCLEKLGNLEKTSLSEFYSSQVAARDLASRLGRPLSTIYRILDRARERLRECVEHTLAQLEHPGPIGKN